MIPFFRDPVAIKELSGFARRWQTYLGRMVYVGFAALVLYQFWQTLLRRALVMNISRSEYAELGRALFSGLVGLQMLFVAFQGASAASDLVTKEVRAGTLGVLAATPLGPFRIALGKWKAAMTQVLTLIFCGVPVLAISIYLGGVGLWELAWSFSIALALGMLGSAVALFCSTVFRSGTTALIVAVVGLLAYSILPTFLLARTSGTEAVRTLSYVHPVYAGILAMASSQGRSGGTTEYGWITATLTSAGVSWILLRASATRIEVLGKASPGPSLLSRTFGAMDRFYEGIGPRPLRRVRIFGGSDRVWEVHALLWKELRTRASGKLRNATRLGVGLLLVVLVPSALFFSEEREIYAFLYGATSLLLLILGVATGVSLFVREKEERKWDVLLSTPLSSWDILKAKLLSGIVALAPGVAFFILLLALLAWGFHFGWLGTLTALLAILLPVGLAYVLGASASLRARSAQTATSLAMAHLGGLLVGVPLLLGFWALTPGISWKDDRLPFAVYSVSHPVKLLGPIFSMLSTYSDYGWNGHQGAVQANLGYFLCFCLFYLLAIGLTVFRMKIGFFRLTGRS
jgi:ABC-type transport system involved in multi-copper enzyme maturation permease subunit